MQIWQQKLKFSFLIEQFRRYHSKQQTQERLNSPNPERFAKNLRKAPEKKHISKSLSYFFNYFWSTSSAWRKVITTLLKFVIIWSCKSVFMFEISWKYIFLWQEGMHIQLLYERNIFCEITK